MTANVGFQPAGRRPYEIAIRRWGRRVWKTTELLLIVITFGLALYNCKDAQELADTLSTHYIGSFPAFLPQLQEVVEQSKHSLLIACDVPGYGVYSSHDNYIAYRTAVTSKVGRIHELKLIVLDSPGRKRIMEEQFRRVDLQMIKRSREFRTFSEWSGHTAKDVATMASFEAILADLHDRILHEDFAAKNVPSAELTMTMPMFVWIGDDKLAVFSIPNSRTPPSEESAFITRDPKLIKQLTKIFRTYESQAKSVK